MANSISENVRLCCEVNHSGAGAYINFTGHYKYDGLFNVKYAVPLQESMCTYKWHEIFEGQRTHQC